VSSDSLSAPLHGSQRVRHPGCMHTARSIGPRSWSTHVNASEAARSSTNTKCCSRPQLRVIRCLADPRVLCEEIVC